MMVWVGGGEGSACSPSCGTHGSCNENTRKCDCDTGYGGDDCSLRLNELEDGHADTTTASSREFVYYFTPYQEGSLNYVYSIQQLNNGDCDVYVKSGSLPSRTIYDWKDTSVNTEFTVTATPTTGATMYIGVYGYRTCSYLLSLSVTIKGGTCPNSCSGNGQCVANNCICHPFYYSSDCSKYVETITEDEQTYEGEVGREEWIYYSIYPTQSQAAASPYEPFSITLSPSSLSNTYIYILKDDYPDLTSFDYRNGVLDVNEDGETLNTITIAIGDPTSNMYYIGVYSQNSNQVTYSISASFSGIEICNEQCSAHGACVEGINSCTCNDGYSGSYCQTLDGEMEDGEEYGGYVKNNAWNYYHLVPASGSQGSIFVTLQQQEEEGEEGGQSDSGVMDCNLYIQSDSLPSKTTYSYRDLSTESVVQIPILNPMGHTWYIGVYGFHYCNYVISQSVLSQCPTGCEEHGVCADGVCQCNDGYTGPSCSTRLEVVERAPEVYTNEVGAGQWHYYLFTLPNQSPILSVTASLRELNSRGLISMYIKSGSKPSLDDFDQKDTNDSSDFHSVSLLVTPSQNHQIYIGIYGESYIPYAQTKEYKMGVYTPNIIFP